MNTSAEITLEWGDGEYLFALKMKQLEELERVCDAPIGVISNRLFTGQYKISDVVHTIRLGLIGGGMEPVQAKRLVEQYVDGYPIETPNDEKSPWRVAFVIMQVVFYGLDSIKPPAEGKETSGKSKPETDGSQLPPTGPASSPMASAPANSMQ